MFANFDACFLTAVPKPFGLEVVESGLEIGNWRMIVFDVGVYLLEDLGFLSIGEGVIILDFRPRFLAEEWLQYHESLAKHVLHQWLLLGSDSKLNNF